MLWVLGSPSRGETQIADTPGEAHASRRRAALAKSITIGRADFP
jgi:hypothetical protein